MSASFQRLSEFAYFVHRAGGRASVNDVARPLRMTPTQAETLASQAVERGLANVDNAITLTDEGRSLGVAMEERLRDAETKALQAFRPYTSYIPERWWP
jgi:hypothetical protein